MQTTKKMEVAKAKKPTPALIQAHLAQRAIARSTRQLKEPTVKYITRIMKECLNRGTLKVPTSSIVQDETPPAKS